MMHGQRNIKKYDVYVRVTYLLVLSY